jgi:hypothetical protein
MEYTVSAESSHRQIKKEILLHGRNRIPSYWMHTIDHPPGHQDKQHPCGQADESKGVRFRAVEIRG